MAGPFEKISLYKIHRVTLASSRGSTFAFQVETGTRAISFGTSSVEEREKWISQLNHAVTSLTHNNIEIVAIPPKSENMGRCSPCKRGRRTHSIVLGEFNQEQIEPEIYGEVGSKKPARKENAKKRKSSNKKTTAELHDIKDLLNQYISSSSIDMGIALIENIDEIPEKLEEYIRKEEGFIREMEGKNAMGVGLGQIKNNAGVSEQDRLLQDKIEGMEGERKQYDVQQLVISDLRDELKKEKKNSEELIQAIEQLHIEKAKTSRDCRISKTELEFSTERLSQLKLRTEESRETSNSVCGSLLEDLKPQRYSIITYPFPAKILTINTPLHTSDSSLNLDIAPYTHLTTTPTSTFQECTLQCNEPLSELSYTFINSNPARETGSKENENENEPTFILLSDIQAVEEGLAIPGSYMNANLKECSFLTISTNLRKYGIAVEAGYSIYLYTLKDLCREKISYNNYTLAKSNCDKLETQLKIEEKMIRTYKQCLTTSICNINNGLTAQQSVFLAELESLKEIKGVEVHCELDADSELETYLMEERDGLIDELIRLNGEVAERMRVGGG